ncbi:MAG TPA: cytochrome c maturation protein CcmE [Porticoccaceae bacterium]|nr:cytochrome c maturation protein CcmE [Porticoccaceae bacterium]HIG66570.1 cytochrome c maturation protein CcmE [Porticoccaceae bacterium]HIK79408.1 cytochrome c maturation protein CcmE [Porticoccaceae bacterium]
MNNLRKQRLEVVLLIIVAGALASGLIIYMLGQNANYFYTPSQIARGEAPEGVFLRAGGMVVEGSLVRDMDSLALEFKVTDGSSVLVVQHTGILPDLFGEGEAAIAAGKVDQNLVLQATEVLAKHDENYMPPEVAESMSEAYLDKRKTAAGIQ